MHPISASSSSFSTSADGLLRPLAYTTSQDTRLLLRRSPSSFSTSADASPCSNSPTQISFSATSRTSSFVFRFLPVQLFRKRSTIFLSPHSSTTVPKPCSLHQLILFLQLAYTGFTFSSTTPESTPICSRTSASSFTANIKQFPRQPRRCSSSATQISFLGSLTVQLVRSRTVPERPTIVSFSPHDNRSVLTNTNSMKGCSQLALHGFAPLHNSKRMLLSRKFVLSRQRTLLNSPHRSRSRQPHGQVLSIF